jgi:hypothetical protein
LVHFLLKATATADEQGGRTEQGNQASLLGHLFAHASQQAFGGFMKSSWMAAVRTGLFALATTAYFASPANAVQWIGHFDPLSVIGDGLFQYGNDPSCGTDGFHTFTALCSPQILSLTADVTDDKGTPGTGDDDTAHLNFTPLLPVNLSDYFISGGQLIGVDVPFTGYVFAAPCTGTLCGPWWFEWTSGLSGSLDPVFFFQGTCNDDPEFPVCGANPQASVIAENVTFTLVSPAPEPATLGLLLGGIGAAWIGRRRKRSR